MKRELIKMYDKFQVDISRLYGNISEIRGNISGIIGDVTNIDGSIDDCEITNEERENGIDIKDLLKTEED